MEKKYKCSKCKEQKTIDNFYQKLTTRQSYCIKCVHDYKAKKLNPDDWIFLFCGEGEWMKHYLL